MQAGPSQPAAQEAPRPSSPTKPKPAAERSALDFRAEEDTARRLNIGRAAVSGRPNEREKADVIPVNVIRQQLTELAKDKRIQFDEEALHYLALSAESHLRALFTSSLSAQTHRATSTHARHAPIKNGKAMWSHHATSDPMALMQAMNAQLKSNEQAFRQDRMYRIQKEKDVAARAAVSGGADVSAPVMPGTPGPAGPVAGPSSGAVPSTPAAPTFGGVTPKPKKTATKKKEHSSEAQHKMSNQTAMRQAFGTKKQYSWMQTMPSQPSPLGNKGGKKRKNVEAEEANDDVKKEEGSASVTREGTPGSEGATPVKDGPAATTPTPVIPPKRLRLTEPSRRSVVVEGGVDRTVTDDRVITIQDVLFVLDRDPVGRGMGWGEGDAGDVVRRAWTLGEVREKR